jgi:hypothetical protein
MYVPSFLEIFLGWVGVVGWASWLRARVPEGAPLYAVAAIPWATGVALMAGMVAAFMGLMQQSAGGVPGPEATTLAQSGSLGSAGIIFIALVTEAGLTILWFVRRQKG